MMITVLTSLIDSMYTRCLFRVKVMKLQLTFDETIELYTTLYDTFMLGFDGKTIIIYTMSYYQFILLELLKSESLKQILFIILLIGNIINGVSR